MDVHPPLAKLLITLAGWLAGFNGDFDFKDIGKDYVEPGVPYVAMRLLPALMGVMTVPTIFLNLKAAGCRTMTAALGAGLVIFGIEDILSLLKIEAYISCRERSSNPISSHSPRFAPDNLYCLHRLGLDLLHQSTRARSL